MRIPFSGNKMHMFGPRPPEIQKSERKILVIGFGFKPEGTTLMWAGINVLQYKIKHITIGSCPAPSKVNWK